MATYATKASDVTRQWHLVDADGEILGRLASEVAYLLRGKHKPNYAPYLDMGDHVIVVNAAKVRVTGRKRSDKKYFHHTGYIGGVRVFSMEERMRKHPSEVIRDAVWGMLPKGPLGRQMIRKLKIYDGAEHRQSAQMPRPFALGSKMMISAVGKD